MTAVQRAICALDEILPLAWGAKVPIYIICSCSNLNMEEAKIELSIPHVRLDLTHETGCLAMSSLTSQKRKDPIIRMREEILKYQKKIIKSFPQYYFMGAVSITIEWESNSLFLPRRKPLKINVM